MEEIDKWTTTDVMWLDELRKLSEDFPSAWDAKVEKITFGPSASGGMIALNGLARDSDAVNTVEKDLREAERRRKEQAEKELEKQTGRKQDLKDELFRHGTVTDSGHSERTEHYSWKFDSTLYVAPRKQ
jgi:hypothetical protein